MTTDDRDFDRQLISWLDAVAPMRAPDDLLLLASARTARTRQRRGWLVSERWTSMRSTLRLAQIRRRPVLLAMLVALLLALIAGLLLTGIGSRLFGMARPPIAFTSVRDGTKQIYVMNPDGTNVVQLTHGQDTWLDGWSPDGSHLLGQGKHGAFDQVFVMNADGTGQRWLTNEPHNTGGAAWSPDGAAIAYHVDTHDSGCFEVYLMQADGSGGHRLMQNDDCNWAPSWSPDSRTIMFSTTRDGNFDIWAIQPGRSGEYRITAKTDRNDAFATFSPDGSRIAFTSWDAGVTASSAEIVVSNPDGSGRIQITNNPFEDSYPTWSPDGRLVFLSDRDGTLGLYIANVDGSGVTRLTSAKSQDNGAAWR